MAENRGAAMTKVKICGNTNIEDARLAAELGADYLGFIFAESKRKISIPTAREIMQTLRSFKNFVGVFFNQPKKEVENIAGELALKTLQFHGEETALYCQSFADKGYEVIKTFRIKDSMSLKRLDEYNVSAFLFDTFSKEESGGTGKTFDWNLIEDRPFLHEKLFLAGGLNILNLEQAIHKIHPFAVDVASGVEKQPGKKDPELLEQFIRIAKKTSSQHA
jgi:phosphoribosylanthranilate isomerase